MNVETSFPIETELKVRQSPFLGWLVKRRWFAVFVILPTALAATYYGFFASNIYVSESRFVIKSPDQKRSSMSSLANLIQTTGLSGGQEQTSEVLAYVRSRDALKALETDRAVRPGVAWSHGDFLARFPTLLSDGSFEGLYKYYDKMVSARLDSETGMAIISAKAFTAEDAYEINLRLLELSEALINRLNARAQTKGIAEAQKQVDLATDRAKAARIAMAQFRNSQALIDPEKQAVGVIEISNSMIAERAALQAQLDLMQRLTPRNPSIPALRNRINAMSAQIAGQDSRVVGPGNGIASKVGGYENLYVEQEFATQNLNVANAALVQTRAEAQKQQFYLERVVDPNLPDAPMLPKSLINVLVVFAAATCLYFIAWMFVIGVLEHASED
ncbi:capsule biosynthesis protein [Sphingobium subterraneum]|uniref:Capsular polysaccharide transport system permease protein n=1 Tax=Sphingobium subterraneum TaxID=627688 RepID=A0A841IZI4_9SPHN|nr:capsule biosynthesis protein [Sphingobium subterraneum]MBB6123740.1 capsular polysaccharide transport system permease protein [Sphingobium subterraneum]